MRPYDYMYSKYLICVFTNIIHCKHRPEFELSKLETIWAEITLPNSKPFLICTAYRPPNATSSWIDLLEEELSASITAFINKSIDSSCFPSQLKIAKIFPIHKSGPKSDSSNYRPISILPTISKLFERHINKHLMVFLK